METRSVAQAMARVLRSSACHKIDFYVGSFHVDAAGFELVAKALDAGKIKIVIYEELGDGAGYNPERNVMGVASVDVCTTALGRSIVVHECVHVLYDIRNTNRYGATDEATSYIAGALYDGYALRDFVTSGVSAAVAAAGGVRGKLSGTTSRAIGISNVYAAKKSGRGGAPAAIGISNVTASPADEYIDLGAVAIHKAAAEAAATVFDRPAARVSDELVKKLCTAIVAHPIYAHLAKAKKKSH